MKHKIGVIRQTDLLKRKGHEGHLSGTGAHRNKKAYTRKIKHKNREVY